MKETPNKKCIGLSNIMKKIMVINDNLSKGGAQKMLAFAISSLSSRYEIVLYLENNTIEFSIPQIVKVNIITKQLNSRSRIFRFFSLIKYYREVFISEGFDAVLCFGPYYTFLGYFVTLGRNGKLIGSERRSPSYLKGYLKWISKFVFPRCDLAVFQLEQARAFYKNINKNRTAIIPNPYIGNISDSILPFVSRRKIVVMAAARLEYEKGFDVGIKAMILFHKEYPEYKLLIYGDGNFDAMYGEEITKNLAQDYISYQGLSKNIVDEIKEASIFLLPSRSEGIPNILMEALGAGIPCIASDCLPGGSRLLIGKNYERGILVNVEDYESIAIEMAKIVGNPEFADSLSKNAIQVREIFSEERIANKWVSSVEGIVK